MIDVTLSSSSGRRVEDSDSVIRKSVMIEGIARSNTYNTSSQIKACFVLDQGRSGLARSPANERGNRMPSKS